MVRKSRYNRQHTIITKHFQNNMIVKSGIASKAAAWTLGTFNFIVMVFCLLWFSFSLWVISSPSSLYDVMQQFRSTTLNAVLPLQIMTVQNGVGSAALAAFLFSVAFMGFYGAVSRSQFLLVMVSDLYTLYDWPYSTDYSIVVVLLLLLECALAYYFSSSLIEKGLQEVDGQWTHALRLLFHCCDVRNATLQETQKVPWSCCGSEFYPDNCTLANVNEKNCQVTISKWIDRYIAAVYTSLAALHLVLSSCSILTRSRCASHSHS